MPTINSCQFNVNEKRILLYFGHWVNLKINTPSGEAEKWKTVTEYYMINQNVRVAECARQYAALQEKMSLIRSRLGAK